MVSTIRGQHSLSSCILRPSIEFNPGTAICNKWVPRPQRLERTIDRFLIFFSKGSKQSVPDDEHACVVLIHVLWICSMVDSMMEGLLKTTRICPFDESVPYESRTDKADLMQRRSPSPQPGSPKAKGTAKIQLYTFPNQGCRSATARLYSSLYDALRE